MNPPAILVIAKDPQPGRAKTRLCPPCSPQQAAGLAAAALHDTLDVVSSVPAARRILVLEGESRRWQRPGWEVIAQRGRGLDERLGNAFLDVGEAALLVGMDTPQLTGEMLQDGQRALSRFDAVLGPAHDGGYWSVGLRQGRPDAFAGVPMSSDQTLCRQRERFTWLGLRTHEQVALRDVDTIADAHVVAAQVPGSRFGRAFQELGR